MNFEQKAITLIKEIEKRHHTPSQVMGSGSFEQELMEEKVYILKSALKEQFVYGIFSSASLFLLSVILGALLK